MSMFLPTTAHPTQSWPFPQYLPSVLTPLPLSWCIGLYSTLAELVVLAKFTSVDLHCCICATPTVVWVSTFRCGNRIPSQRHSGTILLHLCALLIALAVPAFSLPSQLRKAHFFHQEVFSGRAQTFACSFSCKTVTGWLY